VSSQEQNSQISHIYKLIRGFSASNNLVLAKIKARRKIKIENMAGNVK
jgi:hypothetical protein